MAATDTGLSQVASSKLKRNSDDMGWEFAVLIDPNDPQRVKCKLCGKEMSGGVTRMKEHIAQIRGGVKPCLNATPDQQARCKAASEAPKRRKIEKQKQEEEVRAVVNIEVVNEDDQEELNEVGKGDPKKGPMDQFLAPIDPSIPLNNKKHQQNINDSVDKERSYRVGQYLARWLYKKNVPFNAINDDDFKQFCEALGRYGPDWRQPSQYMIREKMLSQEVDRTRDLLKPHDIERANTGCSIMTDAWTDKKRRSIMNLCVHCKLGTIFLGSKEASGDAHTSLYIFNYVDECIEKIGADNVVQVVTDNASNNMGAKVMLKDKRPKIFWTSCATHTINLMVEAIGKLKQFAPVITKAKEMTIFLYAHHATLALMRFHTKKRNIVRPGVTRFASAFLTLQSLAAKKKQLKEMCCSDTWEECKPTRTKKGKYTHATIMSRAFWKNVSLCIKVFEPLVKILRLADGDGQSMASMYGEIIEAKKAIMIAVENSEKDYRVITTAMESKMNGRLDTPLHMAGYALNPYYSYANTSIFSDVEVMSGLMEVVEQFYHDNDEAINKVLNIELPKFKKMEDMFGKVAATKAITNANFNAGEWWATYGLETPTLMHMALRILNLTTSSSGCERNWSVFEQVDAKRRNKLDIRRRDDLVYIQFNGRMMDKRKKFESSCDVLLGEDASMAQDWICEGAYKDEEVDPITGLPYSNSDDALGGTEAMEPRRSTRVRELHEVEEFVSDEEEEQVVVNEDEIEFESDDDGVLETKDNEDEEEPIES
ncbi:hypothetical protein ACQ4PT_013919 [Festuca glaucescens]